MREDVGYVLDEVIGKFSGNLWILLVIVIEKYYIIINEKFINDGLIYYYINSKMVFLI